MPKTLWSRHLADRLSGTISEEPRLQEPLDVYTTWGVGGPAAIFVAVASSDELHSVAEELAALERPYFILGCGSNILVSDTGFDGVVIKLAGDFTRLVIEGNAIVAGAAVTLPALSRAAAEHSLSGLEFCRGIPGTLGGGLLMNAGAHGSDLSEVVRSVSWIDLPSEVDATQIAARPTLRAGLPGFSYRSTSLPEGAIIYEAKLELESCESAEISARMDKMQAARRISQPRGRTAGSVFKNPPGDSAGRLIESAGLKGTSRGGALISQIHANFIVNDNSASADDILVLMKLARERVLEQSGLLLQSEVRLIGFPDRAFD